MLDGLFLGIDCGTQGLKAVVVDGASGDVLGRAARRYRTISGLPHGVSEQRPGSWLRAASSAIREAIGGIDASRVRAIAVSGQQHGLVALDAAGRPVRPAKLWNDVSTAAEARSLVESCGGLDAVRRITGNGMPPGFTASKALWLKRVEPDRFARAVSILLPHDYLNLWLTGRAAAEAGDASGTGWFDLRRRQWSPAVMSAIDPAFAEKVPPLLAPGEAVGTLLPERAKELGLPSTTLVGHGGGDNMMAALGTGNTRPGIVTVSLGTSGTAFAYSKSPVVDNSGELAAFCDSTGGWLPLLCVQNCTNATELVKRCLRMSDAALDAAAQRAPAGANGALLLPFFGGERTPDLPDATASLHGLRASSFDRASLARAAMEGPTLGLGAGLLRMRRRGIAAKEVRLTGGGARSGAWRQICADVFGAPVQCVVEPEGAAFGAALCAAWCWSRWKGASISADDLASSLVRLDPATRTEPVPAHSEVHREQLARRATLLSALGPTYAATRSGSIDRRR